MFAYSIVNCIITFLRLFTYIEEQKQKKKRKQFYGSGWLRQHSLTQCGYVNK